MSLDDNYFLIPAHFEIAKARYFAKDKTGTYIEHSIEDVFNREVTYIYKNDSEEHKELALQLRKEKKIIPAGRPLSQAGTLVKNLSNCFVLEFSDDTREAITDLKGKHFHIQASGGGTGINFSTLRPRGSFVSKNQSISSGAIGFITDISYQSANVSQNGNRSGANMGILEDWHPDLLDFITFKSKNNWENIRKFSNIVNEDEFSYFQWNIAYPWQTFNVSIALSDKFMDQVISNSKESWKLHWKDTEWPLWTFINPIGPKTYSSYEKEITVTAPTIEIAKQKASSQIPFFNNKELKLIKGPYHLTASEWFNKVCKNAWEDGCPGVLFFDMIKKYHNGEYFNPISATNPCAEQPLPNGGVCSLTSLCLPSFFKNNKFQWKEFSIAIHEAIRGLDNLTEVTEVGIKEIDKNIKDERRIGLGTTGIAELLLLEKKKYDSKEGRKYVDELLLFLKTQAYLASIELAKERGPFVKFDYDQYSKSLFFKSLPIDVKRAIKKHGIRNVTLLTQAPVGTTGTMLGYAQGCEPYFSMAYKRNSRIGTFLDGSPCFQQWLKENNINYEDYKFNLEELRKHYDVPDYFVEAHEISPNDHLLMQAIFSKHIDSSVSKTLNMPSSCSVADIENIYKEAFKLNIKSTTIYRDGSKQQILEKAQTIKNNKIERPKELACDIHHVSIKGEKWTVLVGLKQNKPYEIFCSPQRLFEISNKYHKGIIHKKSSGKYSLLIEDDFKINDITNLLETDEHRVVTRLLSMLLRHNISLENITQQLYKANGTISDFSKAILRVLKKYHNNLNTPDIMNCPNCSSKNIKIISNCPQCADCGWSKCS